MLGCGPCEGDCDHDSECRDTRRQHFKAHIFHGGQTIHGKCFQRDGYTPVPGCHGKGTSGWDYCIAKPELFSGGWDGCGAEVCMGNDVCTGKQKCDVCMGDCDDNADCSSGLSCFHGGSWNGDDPVPGCEGERIPQMDYCIPENDCPKNQCY